MSFERAGAGGRGGGEASQPDAPAPGKRTLVESTAQSQPSSAPQAPHDSAARGVAAASQPLPYLEQIRRSFGKHDVSNIQVAIGGDAASASAELGAAHYAYGDKIAFGSSPDLHTVAHEAAHVVQQRAGVVDVKGGVGKTGDKYEQIADAVADAVVAGRSAEQLLDGTSGDVSSGAPPVVQRKEGVDASDFLESEVDLFNTEVFLALGGIKMVARGPYGAQLAGNEFENEVKGYIYRGATGKPSRYYQQFVEPEDITQVINRGRGHDWNTVFENNPREIRDKGPATKTYVRQVAVEVANAIARRYLPVISRYMDRLLERHVRAMVRKAKDSPVLPPLQTPDPKLMTRDYLSAYDLNDLVATHPVDVAVKQALVRHQFSIDLEAAAQTRPDLWARFDPKVMGPFLPDATEAATPEVTREAALRQVNVELKTDEGMHHWVEATSPDGTPATREEVALALFEGEGDVATQYAHFLIDVSPLWGFPGRAAPFFKPQHRTKLLQHAQDILTQATTRSWPEGETPRFPDDIARAFGLPDVAATWTYEAGDPILELYNQRPGLAKQRAAIAVTPEAGGKDEVSVVARLTEALLLCDQIQNKLGLMDAGSFNLNDVQQDMSNRRADAMAGVIEDPPTEWMLADRQATVLADIASGFGEIAARYMLYSASDEEGYKHIDEAVWEALADARAPFEQALLALDFPDVAATRAELGTQRALLLDASLAEVMVHRTMEDVEQENQRSDKTDGFDPAWGDKTNQEAYDFGAARMTMMQDPGAGQQELQTEADEMGILQFDVSIGDKLGAIDDLWHTIEDEHDFWSWMADDIRGAGLQAENTKLRADFIRLVRVPWEEAKKITDKDAQHKAMSDVRAAFSVFLSVQLKAFVERVKVFLTDAEKHKSWSKLGVQILIAVAAFALGQWEFVFLADLFGGGAIATGAAAVVAGATTTLTSMALEKLILGHDPTLGGVIMGFAGNIAIFGWMAKAAMAAKAAGVAVEVGEATVGAAAKLAEGTEVAAAAAKTGALQTALKGFAKEIIFGEVFMLLSGEGASLIDNHRLMSGPELLEAAAMGVVNIIGMKVAQYPFEAAGEMFKAFKGEKLEGKADIAGLTKMRQDLAALGNDVNQAAGGPGQLAKGKPVPRERAQELLDKWREYHKKEQEVGEALLELAEKHPERFKMKMEQLKAAKETLQEGMHDAAELNRQLRQARAILGVEEIGPGIYRGDPAAMDVILAQHKASHSDLVSVSTDPVTGQRTLKFRTADGTAIEMIEKLADPEKRKPPKVSVAKARHFEEWLEKRFTTDTPQGAKDRARMTEYYARDPEAAMHLAETAYEYTAGEVATPELMTGAEGKAAEVAPTAEPAGRDPKPGAAGTPTPRTAGPEPGTRPGVPAEPSAAQKAFEHYEYTREGKNTSEAGERPEMSRADFERWYEAGFEYDPINERWVTRHPEPAAKTSAGATGKSPHLLDPADHKTSVIGEVHSEAEGHDLLRLLVSGETDALRIIGIEAPPEFDSRASEWALGRDQNGKIVVIRGGKGAVDWSLLPGIQDVAHSHPFIDPVTGKPRLLKGEGGSGVVDIEAIKTSSPNNQTLMDLLLLMPSTGDLRFVALNSRGGHMVHTPYVSLGKGKIGNPVEGGAHPTVEIEITKAEAVGLLSEGSEIVVYRGELTLYAGGGRIGTIEIYQRYHSSGSFAMDWVTTERPSSVVPLPADHPIAKYNATPASEITNVGHVSGNTIAKLIARGFPKPGENRAIELALKRVGPNQAETLDVLALHDHLTNFEAWIERVTKNPDDLSAGIKDLERARKALDADTALEIKFDAEGRPTWEGDVVNPKKQAALDKAAATRAETAKKRLEASKQQAQDAMGQTPGTEQWLSSVEAAFAGEGRGATPFFEALANRAGEINLARFRPLVEELLADGRVSPAQRTALLQRALVPGIDSVRFLENVRWLADRSQLPQSRSNLLDSAARGTLDIEWLRSRTELTPAELDELALSPNIPWPSIQLASEYAAAKRAKTYGPQHGPEPEQTPARIEAEKAATARGEAAKAATRGPVRGAAGELVARRTKLPGGFEIFERGQVQPDAKVPDYGIRDPEGHVADLEIKGDNPKSLERDLRDMLKNRAKDETRDKMMRMVQQLSLSMKRRGRVYLLVSDKLGKTGRANLELFLTTNKAMPTEIWYMSEADLLTTAQALREHLGLEFPDEGSAGASAGGGGDQ